METEIDSSVYSYFTFSYVSVIFYLLSFILLALPFPLLLRNATALLSIQSTLGLRPLGGLVGLVSLNHTTKANYLNNRNR